MSNPPVSGIGSKMQAFLVGLAFALGSLGTLTTIQGMIHDTQWQLIIGVIIIVGGIASASIKEALKALPGT